MLVFMLLFVKGGLNMTDNSSKVIAILSGKGGVGRSFLTVSLGVSLALRNKKVLMIDNNPAVGDLAYLTGILGEIVFDVADIIKGRCEAYKAIYKCNLNILGESNYKRSINSMFLGFTGSLDLMPSPHEYDDMLSPDIMKLIIDTMSKRYDYILVDSQSGLGCGFDSSTVSADEALIITTTDPSSVADCRMINDKLIDKEISEIRLVINKFNNKNFIKSKFYSNLDDLIDDCEVQLISLIKDDNEIAIANASLNPFEKYKDLIYSTINNRHKKTVMTEVINLAARLDGENRNLCI